MWNLSSSPWQDLTKSTDRKNSYRSDVKKMHRLFSLLRLIKGQTQTFRGQWFRNFIEAVGLILVFQTLLYALFLGHLLKERELCFFISFVCAFMHYKVELYFHTFLLLVIRWRLIFVNILSTSGSLCQRKKLVEQFTNLWKITIKWVSYIFFIA